MFSGSSGGGYGVGVLTVIHGSSVDQFASFPQVYDCTSNSMYMLLWTNFVC